MNQPIQWRHLGDTAWVDDDAVLQDGLDGLLAVKTKFGWLTVDRNGTTRYSANMGPWEGHYKLDSNIPVLHTTPQVVTYVLEVRER